MMEKQGIVAPEVTPPENADPAKAASTSSRACEKGRQDAIRELDSDFRKSAAEATRQSLQ